MTFGSHLTTFAGLPVRQYDPKSKKKGGPPCVYRVGGRDYVKSEAYGGGDYEFSELLDLFLADHGGKELTALVIGAWDYGQMTQGLGQQGAAEVVEPLTAARKRLPNLRSLFFGDITSLDCEISWISHGDLGPLLAAFPKLEEFRVRGAANLTFGKLRHKNLRSFALESGGLPEQLLQEVLEAELPKLEHLELWLGTQSYGGIADPAPLQPLLEGKRFRKLKYLGLRDSQIADAVAEAVTASALLERLEVLDLSLGNLTDAGAEALLGSPVVRRLKKLDLHHHFLSPAFMAELKKLPLEVDVSDAQEPDFWTYNDVTHVSRYISVSE
jgi:hypothetical protein